MSGDRSYWHTPNARSWHAADFANLNNAVDARSYCGRNPSHFEVRDRVPPDAHLCGSCARSIAARTDIERPSPEDVFEPFGAPV